MEGLDMKKPDMKTLDMKTLKELREEKGLSITDLAAKAGVSPSTIARTESGLPIRNATKIKIAAALKVPLQEIEFFIVRHY
jgi:transcriptional regulator with XRE-family HTH domain